MNTKLIYQFLKDVGNNNNREWFHAHKDEYEAAKAEFEVFTAALITRIGTFDEEVRGMVPSQCTYRIYRDIRFSEDKTPYKTHMGAYVNAHGKKSVHCGYYLQIEPGNCMLCGGSYIWPSNILKAVRQAVMDNIEEYLAIVEDPAFKRFFPTVGEEKVKTTPIGFPKDFKYIDYLRPKDYSLYCPVPDSFFLEHTETLLDRIEEIFRQAKRFADFTNFTIDDFE